MSTTRVQFRVSLDEARAIERRRPEHLTLSQWLRDLALDSPPHRVRCRPRSLPPIPAGTEAEQARAAALVSLAIQLSDCLDPNRQAFGMMPPELEAELRQLAGHARAEILRS